MDISKVCNNIIQYSFTKEKSEFPFNITVLLENKKAILIDTAYQQFAEIVKNDLVSKGISEFIIFVSHHHEDHFDGCKAFLDSITYASDLFEKDYQEHLQTDNFLKDFKPTYSLHNNESYQSHSFHIEFIYTPGHNICEYSFLINNKYLYAGDLIFYNKYGLPSIPYLDANSKISEYIESLEKIINLNPQNLLPGHGKCINSQDEIMKQIDEHLYYLNRIKEANGSIPIDDCLLHDKNEYCGLNFHESNLKKC